MTRVSLGKTGRAMLGVAAVGLLAVGGTRAEDEPRVAPQRLARISDAGLREASGLAASSLDPALLWAHDDSEGPPLLHAVGTDGRPRGLVELEGTTNTDWEDVAAFRWRRRAWLLVADTGDNAAARAEVVLHVLREPRPEALVPGERLRVPVAWSLRVRYPDGPADCEAVGVDPREGKVYLLTKRTRPPVLYSVPLRPARAGALVVAAREAALSAFPRADAVPLPTPAGWFGGQPTGMSFARDRSAAAVLTYDQVYLFRRAAGESWAGALQRAPEKLGPPALWQAEAITFTVDGRALVITGEGSSPLLLRFDLAALLDTTRAAAARAP